MKIRNFVIAAAIALGGMVGLAGVLDLDNDVAAFSNSDCPKGSPGNTAGGLGKGPDGKDKVPKSLGDCYLNGEGKGNDVMTVVNTVLNVIVGVVGVVAVAMMVIGGISIATSQGDTAKVTKGKNTILYGIVGLIVAILAFAIINFVLTGVFGS